MCLCQYHHFKVYIYIIYTAGCIFPYIPLYSRDISTRALGIHFNLTRRTLIHTHNWNLSTGVSLLCEGSSAMTKKCIFAAPHSILFNPTASSAQPSIHKTTNSCKPRFNLFYILRFILPHWTIVARCHVAPTYIHSQLADENLNTWNTRLSHRLQTGCELLDSIERTVESRSA